MRIVVVGGGGREHALAWKLAQSPRLTGLWCAPGNPGTELVATNLAVPVDDLDGLVVAARRVRADLVVIGPEALLAAGLGDRLRAAGIPVCGPSRAATQIEASEVTLATAARTALDHSCGRLRRASTSRSALGDNLDAPQSFTSPPGSVASARSFGTLPSAASVRRTAQTKHMALRPGLYLSHSGGSHLGGPDIDNLAACTYSRFSRTRLGSHSGEGRPTNADGVSAQAPNLSAFGFVSP